MRRRTLAKDLKRLSRQLARGDRHAALRHLPACKHSLEQVAAVHREIAALAVPYLETGKVNLTEIASERNHIEMTRKMLEKTEREIAAGITN